MINRVKGLIIFFGGVVLMAIGIGMWRSPQLNWEGFLAVWSLVKNDIVKLSHDPFTALGIIVLVIGFLVAVSGFRHLVRR